MLRSLKSLQQRSASLLPPVFRALDLQAPCAFIINDTVFNTATISSHRAQQQQQKYFSSRLYTSEAADNWKSIRESFTSIIVDVENDTGIATVTINRPETLNALNTKVRD
jgi:hypothetical protein